MKFSTLFESDDDHEYWASMPHEHLHAETHRIMTSHGFESVDHSTWISNHDDYGSYYENVEKNYNKLSEIGWKGSEADTSRTRFYHPNGSRLAFGSRLNMGLGIGYKFHPPEQKNSGPV